MKHSKKWTKAFEAIGTEPKTILDAIKLLQKESFEKFDTSFTVSLNLNIDMKKVEEQIRGTVILPNGTGKSVTVLVVGDDADQDIAKKAGADIVGGLEVIEAFKKSGKADFDVVITTQKFMPQLAKYGQILGPKGLMPNPKLGTVTNNIEAAVKDIKNGQVEFRPNEKGVLSLIFGKKSFDAEKLSENFTAIYKKVLSVRPPVLKGKYVKSVFISTTMTPAIKITLEE